MSERKTYSAFRLLCIASLLTFAYFHWWTDLFRDISIYPNRPQAASFNRQSNHQQSSETKSCCKPRVDASQRICGSDNCTWTCYDYYRIGDGFVDSLGNEAFFHETSGSSVLNYRQACSVESLARSNPRLAVNVLMITPKKIEATHRPISTLVASYPNIKFTAIDIGNYFVDTPLEKWYFCTDWLTGKYAVSHLSDALRYLTLYKFGGYYFDLDFIIMQSLEKYRSFTAAESESAVAAGVIHFDYDHPLRTGTIEEFRTTYRKDSWANNGPGVIERSLKQYCKRQNVKDMFADTLFACKGFTLYKPQHFYPIHYSKWREFFDEKRDEDAQKVIDAWLDKGVLGAHVWNKLSANSRIQRNSSSLYTRLMKLYCPVTYSNAPDSF